MEPDKNNDRANPGAEQAQRLPVQRENQDSSDPFAALHKAIDRQVDSIFRTIISLPSSIYQQGRDHGQDWIHTLRDKQEQQPNTVTPEQHEEEEDDKNREELETMYCPYLPHPNDRVVKAAGSDETVTVRMEPHDDTEITNNIFREIAKQGNKACSHLQSQARDASSPQAASEDNWLTSVLREIGQQGENACSYLQRQSQNHNSESNNRHESVVIRESNTRRENRDGFETWSVLDERLERMRKDMGDIQKAFFSDAAKLPEIFMRSLSTITGDEQSVVGPQSGYSTSPSSGESLGALTKGSRKYHYDFTGNSTYSPDAVEKELGTEGHWRQKYEDLLREQGKSKVSRVERASALDEADSQKDRKWLETRIVSQVQERWSTDQPWTEGGSTTAEYVSGDKETMAEVEDTWQDRSATVNASDQIPISSAKGNSLQSQIPAQQSVSTPVSVLSTLTTLERVRNPDGTLTEKRVMKKRFSDGTEQTNEVKDVFSEDEWRKAMNARVKNGHYEQAEGISDALSKGKRGWFWNS